MKGTMSAQKAPQGSGTDTRELLRGMEENERCFPDQGSLICSSGNDFLSVWLPQSYNCLCPKYVPGPFPCGFPKIGILQKSGFRAFLGISGCFYGDFRCPRAPEIHIFCLKSRFLREILKKARNPNFRENHMGRPLRSL